MNTSLKDWANIDRLVHEPARLIILTILSSVEKTDFLYLQREAGLTKGNLSAHLSKLEEADYILVEKTYRGKLPLTLVSITETGRTAYLTYRQRIREMVAE